MAGLQQCVSRQGCSSVHAVRAAALGEPSGLQHKVSSQGLLLLPQRKAALLLRQRRAAPAVSCCVAFLRKALQVTTASSQGAPRQPYNSLSQIRSQPAADQQVPTLRQLLRSSARRLAATPPLGPVVIAAPCRCAPHKLWLCVFGLQSS